MTYYTNYQEWREAIVTKGGLVLDRDYCEERILTFQNEESAECQTFLQLYGEKHRQQIIVWFQKVLSEL